MSIEIPEELNNPTIEELETKNAEDGKKKWKPCKRLGKKERKAAKAASPKNLSSLFVKEEKPKLMPSNAKPTLRISLGNQKQSATDSLPRKRGRPPKVKST
jgi:hypothetical protein